MVSVAVLSAPLVLESTEYDTAALPVPLAPAVIDANGELLTAVHGQPVALVTFTVPVPPAAGTLTDDGAMENWQAPVTVRRYATGTSCSAASMSLTSTV